MSTEMLALSLTPFEKVLTILPSSAVCLTSSQGQIVHAWFRFARFPRIREIVNRTLSVLAARMGCRFSCAPLQRGGEPSRLGKTDIADKVLKRLKEAPFS